MKNKNTILSIVFIVAAPLLLWFMNFLSKVGHIASLPFTFLVILYFVLLIVGIFFGWKSLKLKESSILGNLVTLLGIFALLGGIVFFYWLWSWTA